MYIRLELRIQFTELLIHSFLFICNIKHTPKIKIIYIKRTPKTESVKNGATKRIRLMK